MANDAEQTNPFESQRISREMVMALQLLKKDTGLSTGRVAQAIVAAVKSQTQPRHTAERLQAVEAKVEQYDSWRNEIEEWRAALSLRWTTSIEGLSKFFRETGETLRKKKTS